VKVVDELVPGEAKLRIELRSETCKKAEPKEFSVTLVK